jgi:hypothetical protein
VLLCSSNTSQPLGCFVDPHPLSRYISPTPFKQVYQPKCYKYMSISFAAQKLQFSPCMLRIADAIQSSTRKASLVTWVVRVACKSEALFAICRTLYQRSFKKIPESPSCLFCIATAGLLGPMCACPRTIVEGP